MMQWLNLSYWAWWAENCSPAAWTRAWFAEAPRKRVDADTHAEKR